MLLQSQNDEIHLLPALPSTWQDGSLRTRGVFTVDITWADGVLRAAVIDVARNGRCRVRVGVPVRVFADGATVPIEEPEEGVVEFDAQAGVIYVVEQG